MCKRFLNSKLFPAIGDFEDVDHWRKTKEYVFDRLAVYFKAHSPGSDVIFLQHFFREYEQYIFLCELAKAQTQQWKISNTSFIQYLKSYTPDLLEDHKICGWLFVLTDGLYSRFENLVTLLKHTVKLLVPHGPSYTFKKYKYVFTGIGAGDYPTSENTLNFSWPVINEVVKAQDSLFVLDVEPSEKSKAFLEKDKICHVTRRRLMWSLGFFEKCAILTSTLSKLFYFGDHYKNTYSFLNTLHNSTWKNILEKLTPTHFVFPFSAGWPELPEVHTANALNIKTINWFYGTSEFGYTNTYSDFADKNIRFCIRASQELWIWNHLLKELIEKRSFLKSQGSIEVIGPILNGSWKSLYSKVTESNQYRIAVFDITPMKSKTRLQLGEGPYCNAQMQESIYESIIRIHQKFEDVQLVIKTKRAENPRVYDHLPSLEYLQSSKLNRIELLPPNSNPYEAVAGANLVISTPYTSPTILALELGQNAIFYDPLGITKHTYKNAFKGLTIHSEQELFEFISQQKVGNSDLESRFSRSHFPLITPDQMLKNLKARL